MEGIADQVGRNSIYIRSYSSVMETTRLVFDGAHAIWLWLSSAFGFQRHGDSGDKNGRRQRLPTPKGAQKVINLEPMAKLMLYEFQADLNQPKFSNTQVASQVFL